jgi:beta-phosphoglucomutase-like phosphatase (HAD superfamily)
MTALSALTGQMRPASLSSGRTINLTGRTGRSVHAATPVPLENPIARTSPDPYLLKPSPHLIEQAVTANNSDPAACTLMGDSVTDIDAAREAGTHSIGYANKPGKPTASPMPEQTP